MILIVKLVISYKELYYCKWLPMTLTNNILYKPVFKLYKYFELMMACIGRNYSLIKYKIFVFDKLYILFHFKTSL